MIVYIYETVEWLKEVEQADKLLIHQTNIKKCLFFNMTDNTFNRIKKLDKWVKDLYVDSMLEWQEKEWDTTLNNKK